MGLPYFYQLQGASFAALSALNFRTAVVDMDDSKMSALDVGTLNVQGKQLIAYVSIGQAETYRDYWQPSWTTNPPDFIAGQDPVWGSYYVKFWDPAWQDIVFLQIDKAIALGYDGVYLDVVNVYQNAQVASAYSGSSISQEMIDFVISISQYAKAIDPNFKIIPNNGVELLATSDTDPTAPNTAYLNAIDGVGVESLWYNGDNVSPWTAYDLEYIQYALDADKFVLAMSYPTEDALQEEFIANAIDAGLVPFVPDVLLTGAIDPVNYTIEAIMAGHDINVPWAPQVDEPPSSDNHVPVISSNGGGDAATVTLYENAMAVTTVKATDVDPGQTLAYSIVGGADKNSFVLESSTGALAFATAPDYETPRDGGGNNVYNVIISVLDGAGGSDTQTLAVTIRDVAGVKLTGNDSANTLTGTGEIDTLTGRGGNDILSGFGGNDVLRGDAGADTLTGGAGADRFVYRGTSESGILAGARDVIQDFDTTRDRIDFSEIDANTAKRGDQAFTLVSQTAFTAPGQLHWNYVFIDGVEHTILEGNVNSSLGADFSIDLVGHVALQSNCFIL